MLYAVWANIEHNGENDHTDYDDYLNSKLKIFKFVNILLLIKVYQIIMKL